MASTTTPVFTAVISAETEGGKFISLTWPIFTPVSDREFTVDLAAGLNTINFNLSTTDPAAKMCIIIPPISNVETITLVTTGIRISQTNPTILSLDPAAPVTSIDLVAGATGVAGVRIIIL